MIPVFVLILNFHSLGGETLPSTECTLETVFHFPSTLVQKLLPQSLHTGWYLEDLEHPEFF